MPPPGISSLMNSCRSNCFTATIESPESALTNRGLIQNARGWLHDGGGALKTNPCAPVARYWPIASRRSCWCPGTVTPPRRGAACSGRTTLRRQIRHAVPLRWQESLSGSAFWYASQAIPVIAVTSYALSGDEQKTRDAGCDDFVPKPYIALSARPGMTPRVFQQPARRERRPCAGNFLTLFPETHIAGLSTFTTV
jgi:hypothetical protein